MAKVYPERKINLLQKFLDAFTTYDQVIIVDLNNISTEQVSKTRVNLRAVDSKILVGKNSIVRIAIKILTSEDDPSWENYHYQQKYGKKYELKALTQVVGNKIGHVFSKKPYSEIKSIVEKEVVKVPAKAGVISQCDIIIPPQQTNIDPGKIMEFQRIGMTVKTNKSALEIVKEHVLCKKDDLVTETVSSMCRMLGIIPFEYALKMKNVYLNGQVIPTEFLNFNADKVVSVFQENVSLLTAVSLEANLPNTLSIPHMIMNTFKSLMAVGMESEYKFKELEAAMNSQASAPAQPAAGAPAAKEEVKAAEPEPEPEPEMEFGLDDMFG